MGARVHGEQNNTNSIFVLFWQLLEKLALSLPSSKRDLRLFKITAKVSSKCDFLNGKVLEQIYF